MAYFTCRHEPFRSLYVIFTGITVPLIRIPYWAVTFLVPYLRPKSTWTITRSIGLRLLQSSFDVFFSIGFFPFRLPQERDHLKSDLGEVLVEALPKKIMSGEVAEIARINGVVPEEVSGYWFLKGGKVFANPRWAYPDEKVLFYFHGGGYISGTVSPLENYSKAPLGILENSLPEPCRAFGLEYRLTSAAPFDPYAPFPAALIDALSGYYYLVVRMGFRPENVIVAGDSAGGHLALCLVRYLCTEKISELPPPGALILLHPTADWACTDIDVTTSSIHRNYHTDYFDPFVKSGYTKRGLVGSLPEEAAYANAWISPASLKITDSGLFPDFPPTLIIASTEEQTFDAMRVLYTRLVRDNNADIVTWIEYPDCIHDFLCLTWHEPERSQALRDIRGWIERVYTQTV